MRTRSRRSQRWMGGFGAALAVLVASSCPASETQRFTGTARDLKSGRLLYTEQYEVLVDNNRWQSGITRYVAPNGQPIAERKFDFSQDRYIPVFSFDQNDPAYREGIGRVDRAKVDVYMVKDGERKTASLDRTKDMVGDCGAQAYVIDHLDDLQAGKTLRFVLVVAGKVDAYHLRASKVKDVQVNGKRAIAIRVELDSVLSVVLPPLELTFDPDSKRLLEYAGVANVKDSATRKSYQARIVFSYP